MVKRGGAARFSILTLEYLDLTYHSSFVIGIGLGRGGRGTGAS